MNIQTEDEISQLKLKVAQLEQEKSILVAEIGRLQSRSFREVHIEFSDKARIEFPDLTEFPV